MKMMTIDFDRLYSSLAETFAGQQKRVDVESPLGIYYGISPDRHLRLAFRSTVDPPKIESTQLLLVTQGEESHNVYWSCFDLLSQDAQAAYFAFCENLVEAVRISSSEAEALSRLKTDISAEFVEAGTVYYSQDEKTCYLDPALFKKNATRKASREIIQGLYGELYFLNSYMIDKYGQTEAINAWGGPDATSKDFAINTDWYEVKTIGVSSPCVQISSLAQLSSDIPGRLVVVRAERMADEFSNGLSCISELMAAILSKIDDETAESVFISKVSGYGIDISDTVFATKFDVKSVNLFCVENDFPRITVDKIPYPEITNVSYEISVAAISRFLEE